MSVGFRAYKDFKRPDPALVEAFKGIPSSNIGDVVKRMYCMFGGIRPFNKLPLLGVAYTIKVPSGDNLVAQMALDYAQPGDIIVIDGAGYTDRALVGGMMLAYAQQKKIGGFIVDGAIRDIEDINGSDIPVFAKSATPLGPYTMGPGEVNVPIVCGGQVVMPGDILVGDADGVVVIPQGSAKELLVAAKANLEAEQVTMKLMKQGTYSKEEHQNLFTNKFLANGGVFLEKE